MAHRAVPTEGDWIANHAYLAEGEEQSVLYQVNETDISLVTLDGLVLDVSANGDLYVYSEETQSISLYDRQNQIYLGLVSNLNSWRPTLTANEQGFVLILYNEQGESQNYQLIWP